MRKDASLSIVEDIENNRFLMIRHQRGINCGCINFPGGKKEKNETMEQCVIRETFEETGITIKNPQQVGYIEFPHAEFYVYVFKSTEFSGDIKEHKGEVSVFWQNKNDIPYQEMREADRNFLPDILAGKYVKRRYLYDKDWHLINIIELDDIPL